MSPRPREMLQYLPPSSLREKFNASQYPVMIANGTLAPIVLRDGQPDPQKREPLGTRSQYIRYVNQSGQWLVEGHRYLRSDGTLGASGKFDPKAIRLGNTIYRAKKSLRPAN